MTKKGVRKKKLPAEEVVRRINDVLREADIEQAFIAIDFSDNTATSVRLRGKTDGEKILRLESLLATTLCKIVPHSTDREYIAQGEVDLAHLIALDLAMRTIQVGANDALELKDRLMPLGDTDSWVEYEDIKRAMECDTPIGAEKDAVAEEADITSEDVEKALAQIFKGKQKSFKAKDGEITVAGGRLSDDAFKKLASALDRVLGLEDRKED